MTTARTPRAFVLALLASVAIFVLLAHVDDLASAAETHESQGLGRGHFLDRVGNLLAWPTVRNGRTVGQFPEPSLGPLIGFHTTRGWNGLEARYNSMLTGAPMSRDWRTFFLHLTGRYIHGGNVQLTIDSRVQSVADQALGSAPGAVVALQPQTGDVLAMVSKPYCSPALLQQNTFYERCSKSPQRPLLNRAINLAVPPGSAFKIVTLSAAIDTRRFSLSDVFSGADVFGPSPYFDNSEYPSNINRTDLTAITLKQALAFSDNFTFAHVGLSLGARILLKYAHRFNIGKSIPFDLPTSPSTFADGSSHPDLSVLAQSSFGAQTDHVTPLQMALIASTVADGGVMMTPHVVQDLQGSNGRVIWRYRDLPIRRVMSRAATIEVANGMEFVVDHGSGFRAQIAGVRVAGKTGTAASGAALPHAWFICFAPILHPVVAVAVLHEFSGEGFKYAAPIARRVLIAALKERGFKVH